jgi:hypothetical protein
MDLVTSLPKTKTGYDSIIVFVDRLSKMIHVEPTTSTVDAPGVAKIMFKTILRHHGLPVTIVSDRDTRFTSQFWTSLHKLCGTRLAMSTAYHPQTDGQTERANRTIIEMLRGYATSRRTDWDEHLIACEFAYNDSVNPSTGYTPFYLNHGRHPHTPHVLLTDRPSDDQPGNQAALDTIESLRRDLHQARDNMARAQARQKTHADSHKRRPAPSYAVGDLVLLDSSHFRTPSEPRSKLSPRFIGPYPINKIISPSAFQVDLPPSLRRVHPVFNVSHIKPYHDGSDQFPGRDISPPPPIDGQFGELEWTVEEIRDKRRVGRGYQYLIKWLDYPEWECTWEPASRLRQDLPDMVRDFDTSFNSRD